MTEFDPASVARAPAKGLSVVGFRNQAIEFNSPLSGEGARLFGGRFNPPRSFAVIYLCTTPACAAAELTRQAHQQGLDTADLLPRRLWRVEGRLTRVLDLTDEAVLGVVGVQRDDLLHDDFRITRKIGEAAYQAYFQAVLSPSATGIDQVLAVFSDNLVGAVLTTATVVEWNEPNDLPT